MRKVTPEELVKMNNINRSLCQFADLKGWSDRDLLHWAMLYVASVCASEPLPRKALTRFLYAINANFEEFLELDQEEEQ